MLHIMYIKTIDPAEFRLPQDFEVKSRKVVPVHTALEKPPKGEWFQIHPEEENWRAKVAMKKYGDEEYLVRPNVAKQVPDKITRKKLVPCKTPQGARYLWPINLPKQNGWVDPYNKSAADIERQFAGKLIKIRPVKGEKYYEVEVYDGEEELPMPEWSDGEFGEMMGEAFGDRIISGTDHPAFKKSK